MGKDKTTTQEQTRTIDPASERLRSELYRGATNYRTDPNYVAAQKSLAGIPTDFASYQAAMNPLFDSFRAQSADTLKGGLAAVGDQATKQGAFGGTRQGVAEGVLARGAGMDLDQRLAGLSYQGFNDAINNSYRSAGANLGLAGYGQGLQAQALGIGAPLTAGGKQTQTQEGDLFGDLLGAGLSIGSLLMPGGAAAKAAMGAAGAASGGGSDFALNGAQTSRNPFYEWD